MAVPADDFGTGPDDGAGGSPGDDAPTFGSEAALEAGGAGAAAAANEAIEVADLGAPQGGAAPLVDSAPQGDEGPNFDLINAEVQSAAPAVANGPAPLIASKFGPSSPSGAAVADEVDPI